MVFKFITMKNILICLLFTTSIGIIQSHAQFLQKRFIVGFGCTSLMDLAIIPQGNNYASDVSISVASGYFQVNTLLKKINTNTSLSLNVSPGFRLSFSQIGFGSIGLPVTLNLNRGFLSSADSDAKEGITIGLGVNIQSSSLFPYGASDQTEYYNSYTPFMYAQPCIQIGNRGSLGKGRGGYEISLLFGYFQSTAMHTIQYSTIDYNYFSNMYGQTTYTYQPERLLETSATLRMSFVKYFGFKK
jgi:hypothetical protein